jgi:DNA-binding MarR family transcriptional regulator
METSPDHTRDMALLETIEQDPDVNQSTLATQLGVAVGTVNWHIKRLIEKGYIKIKRANRKKLRYIITPEGIAERARLTVDYIEQQFLLYRRVRERVSRYLQEVHKSGYDKVRLIGEGDVADICKLSCIEQGIALTTESSVPVLEVNGLSVVLHPNGTSFKPGEPSTDNRGQDAK